MQHDSAVARLAVLQAELRRDERALIAEGQRLVLHRGGELAELCDRLAGPAGKRQANEFLDQVLWSRQSPDGWPLGTIVSLLLRPSDLNPGWQQLRLDLLAALLRLSRGASDLQGLRAEVSELTMGRLDLKGPHNEGYPAHHQEDERK